MIYAILSDIHANETALRAVLNDARLCGADRVVCLGDVVGYGPLPAACVALVRAVAGFVVAGNHDDAVSGRMSSDDFNELAQGAVDRHRASLSQDALNWLKSLPYVVQLQGAVATHGEFCEPQTFQYMEGDVVSANFARCRDVLMFVGHTHEPCIDVIGLSGKVHTLAPQDFVLEEGKRYIVNVGSVGYPRAHDGVCRSSYVLYDSEAKSVAFRFLPFVVESVMQRGSAPRASRYWMWPSALGVLALSLALGVGIWHHCAASKSGEASKLSSVPDAELKPLAERRLTLTRLHHAVCANVRVADAPIRLRIAFLDATGTMLPAPDEQVVKRSWRRTTRVPLGAVTAVFTVYAASTNAAPRLVLFEPYARE